MFDPGLVTFGHIPLNKVKHYAANHWFENTECPTGIIIEQVYMAFSGVGFLTTWLVT